jgi:HEAT repeat protein
MSRFNQHVFHRVAWIMVVVLPLLLIVAACAEKVEVRPEIRTIAGYAFGESSASLEAVHQIVQAAYGDEIATLQLEKELTQLLREPETSDEARDFICRQLWIIGSDYSVPVLADMLSGEKRMADMALYALQENTGSTARVALEKTLKTLNGDILVGVINTLGVRGEEASVKVIVALLDREDIVAVAAARALGKIDAPSSREALEAAANGSAAVKDAVQKALSMHGG